MRLDRTEIERHCEGQQAYHTVVPKTKDDLPIVDLEATRFTLQNVETLLVREKPSPDTLASWTDTLELTGKLVIRPELQNKR